MAGARRQPQTSIYETTLERPDIEEALETRHSMSERKSTATHNLKVADDRARELLEALELGDGAAVRIGRFVVWQKRYAGREVSFSTDAKSRIRIKPIKE
jgi:hypothetical protein